MAKDSMGFAINHGPSLIRQLEIQLTEAVTEYRKREQERNNAFDGDSPEVKRCHTQRGVVRGLAIAVAQIRNPYEFRDNRDKTIARIEKKYLG